MTPDPDCPFCSIAQGPDHERRLLENSLGFAVRDAFPVTDGDTLVIPKRHVPYGLAVGQTVAHLHIHLIPRYGDEGGGILVGVCGGLFRGRRIIGVGIELKLEVLDCFQSKADLNFYSGPSSRQLYDPKWA